MLVPTHVSVQHGSAEVASLLKSLQQAHEAFIFGTPFAALALMRSIMEAVLRDHYGQGRKRNLEQRIKDARAQLPRGASEAALDRLRKRANAVVHLDSEESKRLPQVEVKLEREIVSLLLVLRALIEGAPNLRPAD